MPKTTVPMNSAAGRAQARDYPPGSVRFDWVAAGLSVWLIGGLYLDGWAHNHGKVDQVFFTPWHAVLYSGALAMIVFLGFNQIRNTAKGYTWRNALPQGYLLSLAGAVLFLLGGGLDFVWHTVFGVEVDLETLLSPTHLVLATSGVLMISGPLRAAWMRLHTGAARGWKLLGPVVVSATLVLSVTTFFTQFAHPINQQFFNNQSLVITSILLQSALLMGVVLLLVGRWRLPFCALTLIFTLNGFLMTLFNDQTLRVLPMLGAGLVADVLLWQLGPFAGRYWRFILFAFLVPVGVYALYFLELQLTVGLTWTIHLWLGSIFMAGSIGLFLGILAAPPSTNRQ